MLINLSELLSNEGDSKTYDAGIDFTVYESPYGNYPVIGCKPIRIDIVNNGRRRLGLHADVALTLNIPCDRCLENVRTDIEFAIDHNIVMDASDSDGIEVEEQDFMDGYSLDVDKLLYPEILMNLPAKVLCRPDCLGLCSRCGANLNHCECGCDRRSLDPRMAAIQDIFNNRKEV